MNYKLESQAKTILLELLPLLESYDKYHENNSLENVASNVVKEMESQWSDIYTKQIKKFFKFIRSNNILSDESDISRSIHESILVPWTNRYSIWGPEHYLFFTFLWPKKHNTNKFEKNNTLLGVKEQELAERKSVVDQNATEISPTLFLDELVSNFLHDLFTKQPYQINFYFPIQSDEDSDDPSEPELIEKELVLTESISIITNKNLYKYFDKNDFGYQKNSFIKISCICTPDGIFDFYGERLKNCTDTDYKYNKTILNYFEKTFSLLFLFTTDRRPNSHSRFGSNLFKETKPTYSYLEISAQNKDKILARPQGDLNPSYLHLISNTNLQTSKLSNDTIKQIKFKQPNNYQYMIKLRLRGYCLHSAIMT